MMDDTTKTTPFSTSFDMIMSQFGYGDIRAGNLSTKSGDVACSGVIMLLGIVGELSGSVAYTVDIENAKKIASTMMMGMPVDEIDEMASSALSELSNMLTARAATVFSEMGVLIDISPPTFFQGEDVSVSMSSDTVLCLELLADDIKVEANIAVIRE